MDAEPVDERGEFAAAASGRCTFALLGDDTLARRDADRIAGGLDGRSVHVEHACPKRVAS